MIGIFGGTFDPVHTGHLRIAIDAMEALELEEVRLIPLARAVHRDQPETPAALRWQMLTAATRDRVGLVADRRELQRDGPSYTVDTLKDLQRSDPGRRLCLLLGTDAFNGFTTWHEPESILEIAHIAVLRRPDVRIADTVAQLYESRRVARLDPLRGGQIVDCPVARLEISSTDIRHRVAAGRRIDFLVPDPVLRIISAHGLYRQAGSR